MIGKFLDKNEAFAARMREFLKEINHYNDYDQIRIVQALHYMIMLQSDQKPRSDGLPYPYHPLAVGKRTLGHSADEVIAALLHDVIEDQAKKIAPSESKDKRADALQILEIRFGAHVRFLVEQLSNPDFDEIVSKYSCATNEEYRELKRKLYYDHIQEIISDDEVARIKLFDFCENALLLNNIKSKKVRLWLREKYLPVAHLFLERLSSLFLEVSLQEEIKERLEHFILEEG